MHSERTLRMITELGLALSIIALAAFAGCGGGGSTNVTFTVQIGGSRQGTPLALTTAVSTLAGSGTAGAADNTTGTLATFYLPQGITTDGTSLYVADYGNNTIRKIVIATGAVTTLAGSAAAPAGALDNTGTLARFRNPVGITTDGFNLYVADSSNNTIRKIVIASGAVTTLAGSAGAAGASDNTTGTVATFRNPRGVTTDGINLYVADYGNNTIRQIVIASGAVTTLAGSAGAAGASDNATGTLATFNAPADRTTDGVNLYVADMENNTIRQIVIASGAVTTLAGSATAGAQDNAIGTLATFKAPDGITTDGTNLFVSDALNNKIRKIVIATGAVTTLAGSGLGGAADSADGLLATFLQPGGITTDGANLYVADTINNKIRKIQ